MLQSSVTCIVDRGCRLGGHGKGPRVNSGLVAYLGLEAPFPFSREQSVFLVSTSAAAALGVC